MSISSSIRAPRPSARSTQMPRSSIRRIFRDAQALQRAGKDVVRLDIGDPDMDLPSRIAEAIEDALFEGKTHYSPMTGIRELREAVAQHMADALGVACEFEHVTMTQGATQGLNAALQFACDAGDSILMPEVYWPNYIQQTTLAGVRPRFYPLDDDCQPVVEALEGLWEPKLRAVLINTPSNPTGAVFSPRAVERFYDFAVEHDLWIIADEAYTDYVYEGEYLSPLRHDWEVAAGRGRTLGVFSFSKSYAATGLRMGWVVAPDERTAQALALMNEPLTGSLTTPLQWGLVQAFDEDDVQNRWRCLKKRRDAAAELLREAGLAVRTPAGGLFFFVDVSAAGMNGDAFADALLEEERVAVVPGSGFGLQPRMRGEIMEFRAAPKADNSVRVCFAVPEKRLRKGIERLATFFQRYAAERAETKLVAP